MKFDASATKDISETRANAVRLENDGYDGLWVGETKHDPFLQMLDAARATDRISIGTAVAIAFGRTPMTIAYSAYDLARHSEGRFILGLGSQVKPHIERRFSMPWSQPAARMRELVLALRAIWASWQHEAKLDFAGEFYTHTLMTPFFAPDAHEWGPPPVYVAGVGELMTEVAGEVADGFFMHPFTTDRYLREITMPALERGRARAGSAGADGFQISGPAFACVGRDASELARAILGAKKQIAFYASTRAYRAVLDLHGWGAIQPELTRMSKQGLWDEMTALIDDEMVHTFAVVGDPAAVGQGLRKRFEGLATRLSFYAPYEHDESVWPDVLAAARER